MKVEHVLLFLVGAFLVYHMMGRCGRVEGLTPPCTGKSNAGWDENCYDFGQDQNVMNKNDTQKWCGDNFWKYGTFRNYQCDGEPISRRNQVTGEMQWLCTEGPTRCSDP